MIIRKSMTNNNIYNYANNLLTTLQDMADISLPVRVHFYIQKNIDKLVKLAKEIEKSRIDIFKKYGIYDSETQTYSFEANVKETVKTEVNNLFTKEQEVEIHLIPLDWMDKMELTAKQVELFSFMIKEPEEEELDEEE